MAKGNGKWWLSGPMTGMKDWNYPLFIEAAEVLRKQGYDIITPVEINPPPSEDDAHGEWWPLVRRDLNVIWRERDKVEGIISLPTWRMSVGSLMERLMIKKKLCGKALLYENLKA